MTAIRFEKVTKKFRDVLVIKDMTLTIEAGEFFTFVGPSGCGKSTALNMIAGLESVSEGKIFFDDKVINDLSPKERDVAMVFQNYALYPHFTVYENIAFPLRMKKMAQEEIRSEVARVSELLGLKNFLKRKPAELSGGQRQRVALGRAIIRKPRVFLLDEPLSNLDARLRIEMRAELKELHQHLKITTVYVTHDQAEALGLSERIAVLDAGQVQQCATPREVYMQPANIFVAGFIGSPPMNFIPASLRKKEPLEIECNGVILSPPLERPPEHERLIVGIRPEDAVVSAVKGGGAVEVTVLLLEPAGSFNWIDCQWQGVKLKGTAREAEQFTPGQTAYLSFPADRVVIFDAGSKRRL